MVRKSRKLCRQGKKKSAQNARETVTLEKAELHPNYNFDSFVVEKNNKLAYVAARAITEMPGQVYNPFYVYGGLGVGKTHLMHAIGNAILEKNPETRVIYVTGEEFVDEVIEVIRSGDASQRASLREKYQSADLLLVDDVRAIFESEYMQKEFLDIIEELCVAKKQVVLSAENTSKEMLLRDEQLRNHFKQGLAVDMQPPGYETRMEILRGYAEDYGINIDEDVMEYLAANVTSSIRELEGALNKVIAVARLSEKDVSLSLAEDALKELIGPEKKEKSPSIVIKVYVDFEESRQIDKLF